MRIIAFGDIHMDFEVANRIPGIAEADWVIVTGDLTNFGAAAEARGVLAAIRRINPRIYALPGNLDRPPVGDYLDQLGVNLHGRGVIHAGLGLFGVGGSNPTPFSTPIEFSEEELTRVAEKGYSEVSGAATKALISHAPPHNTVTDMIKGGAHVGSLAIRRFIETRQPDFCITGHIHEARGEDRIGRTYILNPGMLRSPGWVELVQGANGEWTARLLP